MTDASVAEVERGLLTAVKPYIQRAPLAAFFLGISSGLPFTLLAATLTQRLSEGGIERKTISAFALVLLIYSIKWAWAPIVDRIKLPFAATFGQRRTWLVLCALATIGGIVLLANANPARLKSKIWPSFSKSRLNYSFP